MLKLPKKFQFFKTVYEQPAYVMVDDSSDELLQAIAEDPSVHGHDWQLEEHPDADALEQFWQNVERDTANDPKNL